MLTTSNMHPEATMTNAHVAANGANFIGNGLAGRPSDRPPVSAVIPSLREARRAQAPDPVVGSGLFSFNLRKIERDGVVGQGAVNFGDDRLEGIGPVGLLELKSESRPQIPIPPHPKGDLPWRLLHDRHHGAPAVREVVRKIRIEDVRLCGDPAIVIPQFVANSWFVAAFVGRAPDLPGGMIALLCCRVKGERDDKSKHVCRDVLLFAASEGAATIPREACLGPASVPLEGLASLFPKIRLPGFCPVLNRSEE